MKNSIKFRLPRETSFQTFPCWMINDETSKFNVMCFCTAFIFIYFFASTYYDKYRLLIKITFSTSIDTIAITFFYIFLLVPFFAPLSLVLFCTTLVKLKSFIRCFIFYETFIVLYSIVDIEWVDFSRGLFHNCFAKFFSVSHNFLESFFLFYFYRWFTLGLFSFILLAVFILSRKKKILLVKS